MRTNVLAVAVVAIFATLVTAPVRGQAAIRTPADVQLYLRDWRAHALNGEASPPSLGAFTRVLTHPDSHTAATVLAVINALQEEAERGVSPYTQSLAAHALAIPIRVGRAPYSDIAVARLVQAYNRTASIELRTHLVGALFYARSRDADLLRTMEDVAVDPRASEYSVKLALEILSNNGPKGRAILQRLHLNGAVRNPEGRAMMDIISRHGYQVRRPEP